MYGIISSIYSSLIIVSLSSMCPVNHAEKISGRNPTDLKSHLSGHHKEADNELVNKGTEKILGLRWKTVFCVWDFTTGKRKNQAVAGA
jgi:hypothetical protein